MLTESKEELVSKYITTLNNPGIQESTRDSIRDLTLRISPEFYSELFGMLRQLRKENLNRFTELWSAIPPELCMPFAAFIVSGKAPNKKFLKYLSQSEETKEAIEIAFRAHIASIQDDYGQAVTHAEEAVAAEPHNV